jgi:hypothetical protein
MSLVVDALRSFAVARERAKASTAQATVSPQKRAIIYLTPS